MAVDPRKRQRKLERRKARQKAERHELARRESRSMVVRMVEASAAPVLDCLTASPLWEGGMGDVLLSRLLPNGLVAFADFLVDRSCLGVKNVMLGILPRARYQRDLYDRLADRYSMLPIKPECARKLVEGAVAYARDLGFEPHPEYRMAAPIFGDIRAEDCAEEFEFGRDGKPFFVAGPFDGPARCRHILRTLEDRCGPDGYHYMLPGEMLAGGVELLE